MWLLAFQTLLLRHKHLLDELDECLREVRWPWMLALNESLVVRTVWRSLCKGESACYHGIEHNAAGPYVSIETTIVAAKCRSCQNLGGHVTGRPHYVLAALWGTSYRATSRCS